MRILVVTSTFPFSEEDPVPAFVKDQVLALKQQYPQLQIDVLAPHDKRSNTKNFVARKEYNEYRFHYFWPHNFEKLAGRGIMPALKSNSLNYFLIPFLFAFEFINLLILTRRLRPDVIYAHWFTPQAINARWAGFLTRTPYVFTTHAADVDVWRKFPILGKWIVRSNASRARAITAVSRRTMAKLQYFFAQSQWENIEKKTAIIPMGVDLPNVSPANNTATKNILFVGRIVEKKGLHYLIPAFATITAKYSEARLIIAGDGPWLDKIKSLAHEYSLAEKISFPGYVSGTAKQKLIKSADIYVVPSIITDSGDAEGLPVSLMEGLACGKICVATNESGADDILNEGIDGFLVPQKDIDALSKAIEKALVLNQKGKHSMIESALKTAEQFSWKVVAHKHYEFLFKDIPK